MAKRIHLSSVDTIERLAWAGRDGRAWYQSARREIMLAAGMMGTSAKRLAALLSLFSPRVQVSRSIRLAFTYARTGTFPPGTIGSVQAAVLHYENTGEIRGPKTGPFAAALLGDPDAIVLDTWMAKAFRVPQQKIATKNVSTRCKRRIRKVAERLGWTPAEVQAAVWTATVRRAGRTPPPFRLTDQTLWGMELVA